MIRTEQYLSSLTQRTDQLIRKAEDLLAANGPAQLSLPPAPGKWSAHDCLEHLNLYGDFYLPAMEKAIARGRTKGLNAKPTFRHGWLGSYFTRSMQTSEQGIPRKPMVTFKDKDPLLTGLPADPAGRFLKQKQRLLAILKNAETVNLQRVQVPISIAPWLTIRLADALDFLITHEERHMIQAQKAIGLAQPKMG